MILNIPKDFGTKVDNWDKLSPADREREFLFRTALRGRMLTQTPTWSSFMQAFKDGYFFIETEEGLLRLHINYREIIPFPSDGRGLHIPRATREHVRKGNFRVSLNQSFEEVLHACAKPRAGDEEDRWIRERMKHLLRESHAQGYVHSLEIWKDGALAGGALAIHIGAVFTSLSVFRNCDGAGNVAYIELHKRLHQAGFLMHDTIAPSNLSRFHGGHLISYQEDFCLRRKAVSKCLVFPCEPAILPLEEFPEKHPPMSKCYGRPFAR